MQTPLVVDGDFCCVFYYTISTNKTFPSTNAITFRSIQARPLHFYATTALCCHIAYVVVAVFCQGQVSPMGNIQWYLHSSRTCASAFTSLYWLPSLTSSRICTFLLPLGLCPSILPSHKSLSELSCLSTCPTHHFGAMVANGDVQIVHWPGQGRKKYGLGALEHFY